MTETKEGLSEIPDDLGKLDELIRLCYQELTKKGNNIEPKLGEFMKLIELRHKLSPGKSAQKEFWHMLEQIRQESLQADNVKPPRQRKKTAGKPAARSTK